MPTGIRGTSGPVRRRREAVLYLGYNMRTNRAVPGIIESEIICSSVLVEIFRFMFELLKL